MLSLYLHLVIKQAHFSVMVAVAHGVEKEGESTRQIFRAFYVTWPPEGVHITWE